MRLLALCASPASTACTVVLVLLDQPHARGWEAGGNTDRFFQPKTVCFPHKKEEKSFEKVNNF
jgi:hypothetical protein